jgi:membrane fusion protein, multidrug efflux system
VVMLLDTLKDVVTVPAGAVQRGAPGNYVYVVDEQSTVSVRTVKLGAQDGDHYAVESGLAPGERVVTDGADRLRDGAKVTIPESPAPTAPSARPGAGGRREGNPNHPHGTGQHHRHAQPGDSSAPDSSPQPGGPQAPAPASAPPSSPASS